MDDDFDAEKFTLTLNTLGTQLSMVDQMLNQSYWVTPDCWYQQHLATKLMSVHAALLAMNSVYTALYEQYKETQTNG